MKNVFLLLFGLLLLTACSTQRKLQKKIDKAQATAYQYPDSFALYCGQLSPPKTEYIKGQDITTTDTINQIDTVTISIKGENIKVPCPAQKVITKTVFRTDTLVKENTAKIDTFYRQNQRLIVNNQSLNNSLQKSEKDEKALKITIGILIAGIALCIFLLLKK